MRKMINAGLVGLALTLLLVSAAPATLIVDTGTPSPENTSILLKGDHWIAGEFTTSQEYTVTSEQVYIWFMNNGGSASAAILKNDGSGGLPGTTMFSQTFTSPSSGTNFWMGPTSLNWDLPAGTYWAVFEASSFSGYMGGPAAHPLAAYAYDTFNLGWNTVGVGYQACVEVGATAAVPLPATFLLLGSGLLGLTGWRRFRKV